MQWFKVTLPAAECDTGGRALQNDFETLFTIKGAPKDAGLFGSKEAEHHFYYFSPGAVAIARGLIQHFSGEPCPAPVAHGDNPLLLVGHRDERDILLKNAKVTSKSGVRRKLHQILGRH